jgi:hypothetical protein
MGDPETIVDGALPWLAQLVGVKLGMVGGSGLTPWSAFDPLTWTVIDGTAWGDLEESSPAALDFVDLYRNQVATAYNGMYHGQTLSVKNYLSGFLESQDPDDVEIVKHCRGNPNYVMIRIPEEEDPDPGGTFMATIAQQLMPIGVTSVVEYTGTVYPAVAGPVVVFPGLGVKGTSILVAAEPIGTAVVMPIPWEIG